MRGQEVTARDVLVRGLPSDVSSWVANEAERRSVTQREVMISAVSMAARREEQAPLFNITPFRSVNTYSGSLPFKFIDLFAGIGGLRLGLEAVGGSCVFSSEWDKYCQRTYANWFGELPHGDIHAIDPREIPDHDVLAAGFPCQPFSIAGVSKKNALGRPHGFQDATQGNLFFNVATIVQLRRPPVVLLENVKNLKSHDQGRTWGVIKSTLEEMNYKVLDRIINARHWVPQHRERIFIVCFDKFVFGDKPQFSFPDIPDQTPKFRDILERQVDPKYTLTDHLWGYLQDYAERHRAKGNGFGFGLVDLDGHSRTLSARYYKDGSEILIPQGNSNPRRLTPTEAGRLMGFDTDRFPIVVSDTQAYKQFGNAVVPKVAEAVAQQLVETMRNHITTHGNGCLLKADDEHLYTVATG